MQYKCEYVHYLLQICFLVGVYHIYLEGAKPLVPNMGWPLMHLKCYRIIVFFRLKLQSISVAEYGV
jgi:hypothetical protein